MNKVSKKNIINVLLYTIGIISTGLGINVLIKSSLGAGAWDAVANNFSKFANITLGSAGAIVNIIILAFIILYNKKIKFLFVIVPIIGIALATDFWDIIVFGDYVPTEYWLKLIFFVVGTAILTFGLTSIIISTFPAMVYDELTIAFMKILSIKSFFSTRIGIEMLGVSIAILFGFLADIRFGAVSFGTLILSIIIGPLISLHMKWMEYVFHQKRI